MPSRASTSASMPRAATACGPFMPARSPPGGATTASPAYAPATATTTTRPSSSIRTVTGSRPIAVNRSEGVMPQSLTAILDALQAGGPAVDRGGNMDLYAWLIAPGSSTSPAICRTAIRDADQVHGTSAGMLEGRAIQAVWIVPARGEARAGDAARNGNVYGTPPNRCLAYSVC